jgi:heme A synthase
VSDLVT